MNQAEFAELEQAFERARSLSPGSWAAVADDLESRTPGAGARLRRMLHAHADTVDSAVGTLLGSHGAPAEPESIGPYRLIAEIGQGGFGVVHLAEQREPIRRLVAVKVIKPGMDTRAVLRRFEAEREALARMEHPSVVAVLDAGATAGGRPYVVMPLVSGLPITAFCAAEALDVRERVRLMVRVCRGVQHAHAKGVLHRDLKPGNILVARVDGVPEPRIIDFGLARALADEPDQHTAVTLAGQPIGTPEYMSPEQARGGHTDARSDVYALGVVLYELLAGAAPFARREGDARAERLLHEVREREPGAPSTLAKARVARELDWITLRCLEKDPARRYQTSDALAADLERFLGGERVEAGPAARAYRLWRWARRRWVALAVAGVIVAITAAGAVLATDFALRERAQRIRAEQVSALNRRMITGLNPEVARGRDRTLLLELVRSARQSLDEGDYDAAVRADVLLTIAQALQAAGEFTEAHAAAVECLESLDAAQNPRAADVADALVVVVLTLEEITSSAGAECVAARRRLQATLPEAYPRTDARWFWTTYVMDKTTDMPFERVLSLSREADATLGPAHPMSLRLLMRVAAHLVPHPQQAMEFVDEYDRRTAAALGPDDPQVYANIAQRSMYVYSRDGRAASIAYLRERLPNAERVLGERAPAVIRAMSNMGCSLYETGECDEAEVWLKRSRRLGIESFGRDSPWITYVDGHLVRCYASAGRASEAAALARDMLRDHPPVEDARKPQPRWEAGQLAAFADLFARMGNQDLAEQFGREHAALQAITK